MKKIIFIKFIIILSFNLNANANANWIIYFSKPNGDIYYYDDKRMEKKINFILVWNRIKYKTSVMGALSYQSLIKIDCEKYKETTLQNTFFIDKNWKNPAMSTNKMETSMIKITKNSHTMILKNKLCY